MAFSFHDVKEAYQKLRTYIYYDNTDILLRRKLVEFETNRSKDVLGSLFGNNQTPYRREETDIFKGGKNFTLDEKLEQFANALNDNHKAPEFFDHFLGEVDVSLYPKAFKDKADENIITNQRIKNKYELTRLTAFIDAPIELHLISVLWILNYGSKIDKKLSNSCYGNRLLLAPEKAEVIKGSSLFRPYFGQYQKWRDETVTTAQTVLKKEKNALVINLDIRDYFHSVRIPKAHIIRREKPRYAPLIPEYNLLTVFYKIHEYYTRLICKSYHVPYDFADKIDLTNEVILPIGLLSSYVLANDFLSEFDKEIERQIKPAYYGRYVDDIMMVISEPDFNPKNADEFDADEKEFNKYKARVKHRKSKEEQITAKFSELNLLEKYFFKNLRSVFSIYDTPVFLSPEKENGSENRVLKINSHQYLYCQSDKTFAYFFDHEESDLVIDKLKKQLNERTSEFRDFPEEDENEETFEESAYHLNYDNADAKIRTLKDYKEDRFGLTVFLTNNIFSALRHDPPMGADEINEVLKFFKGLNCLEFYRLWEKIFTFFLVNKYADGYVRFYLHCIEELKKIDNNIPGTKVTASELLKTMFDYLDCAHELTLALNPGFIESTQNASRHFEFRMAEIQANPLFYFDHTFEPTKPESFWVVRFREANMIRQHYVVHPLLSYTKIARTSAFDLTSLKLDLANYELDEELLENSPRPAKFYECCIAKAFENLKKFDKSSCSLSEGRLINNLFNIVQSTKKNKRRYAEEDDAPDRPKFYLDDAYELFKKINSNHFPPYIFESQDFKDQFFTIYADGLTYDKTDSVCVQEILVNTKEKLPKPKIAFANTMVDEKSIIASICGDPVLSRGRYQRLSKILRTARKESTDILLFPEFFVPVNLLSSITRYAEKNQVLTALGLEHLLINGVAFNFIITILPVEVNKVKDAVVVFRLKNHYAPSEELLVTGNHAVVPKPIKYRYDIFNWRNIYFSTYYCFELANSLHRSLMKGKIDLLIGVEWNKDTNYYANIVEASTRDLHLYMAQVNTSQYGDTRLTAPVASAKKDILRLKGGTNDAILVTELDIEKLRTFQRQTYDLTHNDAEFKPLPPDFPVKDVINRIKNKSVI